MLHECVRACNNCADSCLSEDNVQMMAECIRTDIVCAAVCKTTADILASDFRNVEGMIKYCAEVCEQCADECEKHDHSHCQKCASICRKCAAECESLEVTLAKDQSSAV